MAVGLRPWPRCALAVPLAYPPSYRVPSKAPEIAAVAIAIHGLLLPLLLLPFGILDPLVVVLLLHHLVLFFLFLFRVPLPSIPKEVLLLSQAL
jgi:hypothetical protein